MKTEEHKNHIMGRKSLYLLIVGVLVAYYVYIPLPGDFEDPWKLILLNAKYKAVIHLVSLKFYEFTCICNHLIGRNFSRILLIFFLFVWFTDWFTHLLKINASSFCVFTIKKHCFLFHLISCLYITFMLKTKKSEEAF